MDERPPLPRRPPMAWLFPKRVIRYNLHIYAWMSYAELRALHSMIGFADWQQLEDLRMEADAIMIGMMVQSCCTKLF